MPRNIRGSRHDDLLDGDNGDNLILGNGGNDYIVGMGGNDNLQGGDGNDLLYDDEGNDRLRGGAGNDTMVGGAGTDEADYSGATEGVSAWLYLQRGWSASGREGEDMLVGIENIRGTAFGDHLVGDAGANDLRGLGGNDSLSGGAGRDTLRGGAGDDVMAGGADNDRFIFDQLNAGADTISDFQRGDVIDLVDPSFYLFTETAQGDLQLIHQGGTVTFSGLTISDEHWINLL